MFLFLSQHQNIAQNIQFLAARHRTKVWKNNLKNSQKHWQHNTRINRLNTKLSSAGKKTLVEFLLL